MCTMNEIVQTGRLVRVATITNGSKIAPESFERFVVKDLITS